jgi:hypothetical protein
VICFLTSMQMAANCVFNVPQAILHPTAQASAMCLPACALDVAVAVRVIRVSLAVYGRLPLYAYKQTLLPCVGMSQMGPTTKGLRLFDDRVGVAE